MVTFTYVFKTLKEARDTFSVDALREQLLLEQMGCHIRIPLPLFKTGLIPLLYVTSNHFHEKKTWPGTNPEQMQSIGPQTQILDSLLPHSLGFSHATWHFSESTHRSSPPTVVKSDNPIITAILNGLFRSEVSQATVCTASPSALTRLCRFMQMRSNPRDAGDSGVFKLVSWPFSVPLLSGWWRSHGEWERESEQARETQRETGRERCDEVLEEPGGERIDEWEDESERAAARR